MNPPIYIYKFQTHKFLKPTQQFPNPLSLSLIMSQQKQLKQYFHTKVNPTLQPLIYNLVKYRPQDLLHYCIRWFRDEKRPQQSDDSDNDQIFQDVSQEQFKTWRLKRLTTTTRKIRTAICSQVYGPFHKRDEISLRQGSTSKDQTTQMKILFFFMNSFLFSHFSQQQKKLLIDNMIERTITIGEKVIKQGQYGDHMYFVAEGEFECYHEGREWEEEKRTLKVYRSGDIFGELCILHNSARMATIEAKTNGFLYCLDRRVYRHIKKLSIAKKRKIYTDTMKKINLFQNFQKDQLQKICDVLTQVTYQAGNTVIIQGDTGNKFYIVLDGVLVAYKGKSESVAQCFKEGDYFGEIALLNDTPRQASVKAVTKCTLVYLTQDVFKRIVNREKIEKEIAQKYKQKKNVPLRKRQQKN